MKSPNKITREQFKGKLFLSRSLALEKLGIRFPAKTDPYYMSHFLRLTGLFVLLREPKNPKAKKSLALFKTLIHTPVSFEPVFNGVMIGIEKNQLLKEAMFPSTLSGDASFLFVDDKHHVAYYLLILEVIVRLMLNDFYFYAHVIDSFSETNAVSNYKKSFTTVLRGFLEFSDPFIGVKIASVAPLLRNDLNDRENRVDASKDLSVNGLSLNISQAVARDTSELNKLFGLVLIARLQGVSVRKKYINYSGVLNNEVLPFDFWRVLYSHNQSDNKVLFLREIDGRWNDLYITWNLIFVLRNYPQYAVFFFSKLCIPSVLNAEAEFLIARVYAIWVTFFVVENIMHNAAFFSVVSERKDRILDSCERRIASDVIRQSPFSLETLNAAAKKLERFDVNAVTAFFSTANGKLFDFAERQSESGLNLSWPIK